MRWLINYIRSCFCVHDFERETLTIYSHGAGKNDRPIDYRISATCQKCGYHRSYPKFGT